MQASLRDRCAVAPSSIDKDVLDCRSDYGAKGAIRQRIRIIHVAIIECVPNISEGRRAEVVARIVDAVRRVGGARLLDYSSDASHNRSVLTIAGDAAALKDAVLALFETALADIDLRMHKGEHPRLGVVDVVPFVPIEGVTMEECVALAKETARTVAERFAVPVYLYEEASTNPLRKNLEDIRRGEFEGLAAKMTTDGWAPDYGPPAPHPTAGASVIGARMPLIAYNINLATDRLDVAKRIAAAIRFSSGGFRYVKAMGVTLADRGVVQVSINLTNYEKTPMLRVFEAVKREAERYGVSVLESEIVGLVPSAALVDVAQSVLQLSQFRNDQILEARLRAEPGEVEKLKS
jgi:glutamate formiminotransferase / 5-formyltetrahydrofolate cyclo-ligase